jgi:nicotinamide-nucleotide amidase
MSLKSDCKRLAETIGALCVAKHQTLATAESCTGGMIGAALTSVSGASAWFRGGIIAYDNYIKKSLLHVPDSILASHGAVSEETVACMAGNASRILDATCAIAVSGIAGPEGGTPVKPVGLVYMGIYCSGKTNVYKKIFAGDRETVRELTVTECLKHCITALLSAV